MARARVDAPTAPAGEVPRPVVAAARVNVHVNRRAMPSSATVITVDPSPGAKPAPPVRSFRRRAASQVGAASKYTTQSSLVAYKVQERLWWRKTKVPFGPFMVIGTFLALFFGQAVVDWYAGMLGL